MKTRELTEYKNKDLKELEKDVRLLQEKLNGLRFDLAAGKVKNIHAFKTVQKSIAQLLTLINVKKHETSQTN